MRFGDGSKPCVGLGEEPSIDQLFYAILGYLEYQVLTQNHMDPYGHQPINHCESQLPKRVQRDPGGAPGDLPYQGVGAANPPRGSEEKIPMAQGFWR